MEKGVSTIFFSATLLPMQYHKKLLSTGGEDYAIYAKSSFDPMNRAVFFAGDVSTKYTLRGEKMYQKYAEYLISLALSKKGNYIAFFPSYKFMEEVYDRFLTLVNENEFPISYVMQAQYMSENAREIFLEHFETEREEALVGFCVMGGIFSEGIDLTEDKLIGAAIIGTGLPQVCTEREIIKKYFDKLGVNGFDYAYLYPGMNKVLQAAGRVIRTETDRGVILLLDDRFYDRRYETILPREWENTFACNLTDVQQKMQEFWENNEKK